MKLFAVRLRIAPPRHLKDAVASGKRGSRSVHRWYTNRFGFDRVPENYLDFPALPLSELRTKAWIRITTDAPSKRRIKFDRNIWD